MKLPFNVIIGPLIRPYLNKTRTLCQGGMFILSIPYTYLYSTLGIIVSANHLRKHLGELPGSQVSAVAAPCPVVQRLDTFDMDSVLVHDLKIIATSMGLIQYACLLMGCLTENPALFLPHLLGQLVVVSVKILNTMLMLTTLNKKNFSKLSQKIPAIMLIVFNWLQEFCVFRQFLCVCDL